MRRDHSLWHRAEYSSLSLQSAEPHGGRSAPRVGRQILAAVFTHTVDLKSMASRRIVVAAADFLLELIDFAGKKFHGTAAPGAHHVVMAAAVVLVLVAGDAVVEGDFAGEAALGQQFQSAIHGRVADARVFLLHQAVQFVGGEVVAGFEKGAEDSIALRGLLEADPLKMLVKNSLSFPDHLHGDRGLVINALLQHEKSA
jgi:hypothetical protein